MFIFIPSFSICPLPDVRKAGLTVCWPQPLASWRRGISQMFGCIFKQALWMWREWTVTGRKRRLQMENWRNFYACSIFSFDGHFWSCSVFISSSLPLELVSEHVYLGCEWRAMLKANLNLVRNVGMGEAVEDLKWKACLHLWVGCCYYCCWTWTEICVCACEDAGCIGSSLASHVKSGQEQKCLLGEFYLAGRSVCVCISLSSLSL